MNTLVLAFILWSPLVYADTGVSLQCYQCTRSNKSEDCPVISCKPQDTKCLSFHVEVKQGTTMSTRIVKSCLIACNLISITHMIPATTVIHNVEVKCCSTSMCNGRAASVSGRGLLLSLGLGFLQALP